MAIRAYITTLVSSIQAAENIEEENRGLRFTKTRVAESNGGQEAGRRALLLSTVAAAIDSKTQLHELISKCFSFRVRKQRRVFLIGFKRTHGSREGYS